MYSIFYLIVLLTFVYILSKNYKSLLKIVLILCFYSGLAAFHGKAIENSYKILLAFISVFILFKNNSLSELTLREKFFLFIFLLFSGTFIYSGYTNKDGFNLIFSQYCKYITPVCLFFLLNNISKTNPEKIDEYKTLFFSLLNIQIFLSFVKIITIRIQEQTVGSITYAGGGPATLLPVLGFMLLWLHNQGEMKKKDWGYVFLLLMIGFVSIKRAIWFITPVFIFLFLYFVPKKVNIRKLIYFIPLLPLIFYLGVRFNPTLNKEGEFGGSFDLKFVTDYVWQYNFGKTSQSSDIKLGSGRGGVTLLVWDKLLSSKSLSDKDYWGYGLREMYTTSYETFDQNRFGINSKGAATGIFQSYISSGYIGILMTLLLIFSIIRLIKNPRIRITIALFILYDYLFYSGLILRIPALFILFFFVIIFSNQQTKIATNTVVTTDNKYY